MRLQKQDYFDAPFTVLESIKQLFQSRVAQSAFRIGARFVPEGS